MTSTGVPQQQRRLIELLEARRKIGEFFRIHGEELANVNQSQTLPADWVIEFARYTTLTLQAPPGWVPGAPLTGSHPPAPQPEQMRDSTLQRFNQRNAATGVGAASSSSKLGGTGISSADESAATQMKSLLSLQGTKRKVHPPPVTASMQPDQDADIEMDVEQADQIEKELPPDQPQKKTRQININYGMSDSDDDD
jgi:hypothetical protein